MIEAFDVHDVNPNPACFDPKKCEAITPQVLGRPTSGTGLCPTWLTSTPT